MSTMTYDGPNGPTTIECQDWRSANEYLGAGLLARSIWRDTPTATAKIVAAARAEGVTEERIREWVMACGSEEAGKV